MQAHNPPHFYEVIVDSQPCHIYFDLEFSKGLNPGRVISDMSNLIIVRLENFIPSYLGGGGRLDLEASMELDASDSAKASRHLVVRLAGGRAMRDNKAVGMLVRAFMGSLTPADRVALTVRTRSGQPGCVVDAAVYDTNRPMRTLFSSKRTEPRRAFALHLDSPLGVGEILPGADERDLFCASLICADVATCSPFLVDAHARLPVAVPSHVARPTSAPGASSLWSARMHACCFCHGLPRL